MDDGRKSIGFVTFEAESSAVIHTDALILQRTSNGRQKRRVIAAVIRKAPVPGQNGFVSENHTILILPQSGIRPRVGLRTLCRLQSCESIDSRFRLISGTVSVSVAALRLLPLPQADIVVRAFEEQHNDDLAAEIAYPGNGGPAQRARRAMRRSRAR